MRSYALYTVTYQVFIYLKVVNKASQHGNNIDWSAICRKSSKVITFVDLAGHEKYLKTTDL